MGRPPQRLTIPGSLNALAYETYGDGTFGQHTHSALGRECSKNDRELYASLRRCQAEAFPMGTGATPLTTAYLSGQKFGPWQVWGTPGVRTLSVYLYVNPEHGAGGTIVPFTDLQPYQGIRGDSGDFTFAGLAPGDQILGPINIGIAPGAHEVGFVIHMNDKGTGAIQGNCRTTGADFIRGETNDFAAFPSAPTRRIIRVVDTAVPANELIGFRDILEVYDSAWVFGLGAGVDDGAEIWPRLDQRRILHPAPAMRWEVREVWYMTILSITLREDRLTGRLPDVLTGGM